ncbi:MAG TPA: Ku protein [Phycisphaerales bacterium]|nr:Ku protein [Phycisphaerales bacterium]
MARPVWRGHISFGLVNIPVNLYTVEQRADLQLHLIDSRDQSRVVYERVNAETGQEVPWDTIVRGYEYSKGNYVILNDAELKRAAPEATKAIEIESFVKLADIDVMYFDKPYYVEPGKHGKKGYVLLREVLKDTGQVGIARVVIRTRQYMAAVMPQGNVLILELLRYAQELKEPKGLEIPSSGAKANGVTPQELKIAQTLVESMTARWEPERNHDEYRDALMKWIDKKIKAGDMAQSAEPEPEAEEEAPAPINFMELLKKSVEHKQPAKSPAARSTTRRSRPAAARKATTRRKAG